MFSKVLVLGIDGLTLDALKPWMHEGKLKTFNRLVKTGAHGKIRTTIPPYTSPAIPAFYTGKNPGKMNIVHFVNPKGTLLTLKDVKSLKLWDYLSIMGMKCCIVNLPLTCPSPKIYGVFISGPPTTSKRFTYPEDLLSKIGFTYLKEDDILDELISYIRKNEKKRFINRLIDLTENHIKVFKRIQRSYGPFELGLLYIRETDILQHYLWNNRELMLKYYIRLDELLDELINEIKHEYLFIFSDHGFHQAPLHEFYINTWLMKRGYIRIKKLGALMLRFYSKLPPLFKRMLLNMVVKRVKREYIKMVKDSSNIKQILSFTMDLKKTVAIALVPYGVKILDVSHTYHEVLNKLYRDLKMLKDQNNIRVFDIVLMRNEEYSGKYSVNAPDIIMLSSKYKVRLELSSKVFKLRTNDILQGGHDAALYGELIVSGNGIKKGSIIKNATIYDILPTILYVLNLPIPTDIDGKVLLNIFKERRQKPIYVDEHFYIRALYKKKIEFIRKVLKIRKHY